jgi:DNA-binding NarL/FixJ family response regulator
MTSILTPRQHEVLCLLGEGLSTREIAGRLVCAETTARNHVQAILTRLGCSSRLAAVLQAQRLGLL